ncbi:MAG: hypothetical protein IM618_11200 [Cytophagales bacterium]|jgi:hypothetical protein|nr:hypothetical protein [Cytophagales bacterium]
MNRTEHLLTILGEEGVEVSQRCSKANRFSLQEVQPDQTLSNADRILEEFYQACAMVEMLQDEKALPVWSSQRISMEKESKKIKVEKFLLHSKENGTLI